MREILISLEIAEGMRHLKFRDELKTAAILEDVILEPLHTRGSFARQL